MASLEGARPRVDDGPGGEPPAGGARVPSGRGASAPSAAEGQGARGTAPSVRSGPVRAWWLAARPKTLGASLVPVAVGTATAAHAGALRPAVALGCAATALLLQVGTNLVNDAADFARGVDGADRLGPPRAAASGWLAPASLWRGAALCLAGAALGGLGLVAVGGPVFALLGALALLAAVAYTAGPFPLADRGLGDPVVFVFFGPVAVVGTHALQAGAPSALAAAASLPLGLLAALLLAVNNLRDRATDAAAGKRTLAVRLGPRGARCHARGLLAGAYLTLAGVAAAGAPLAAGLALGSAPLGWRLDARLRRDGGRALNAALGAAAQLAWLLGALLAIGLAAGSPA